MSHRLPDRAFAVLSVSTVLLSVLFVGVPGIDLAASSLVHVDGSGFVLRDTAAHAAVDRFLRPLAMVTVAGYLVLAGLSLATGGRFLSLRLRHVLCVGLVFAIGPGLLVNGALKNWIGRARPKNIAEFGGERLFSPAYVPADQCLQNCAFVSGDVAFIAAFLAPVLLLAPGHRRAGILAVVVATVLAGFYRMATGAHFLSDVVLAALMTWTLALAVHGALYRGER